MEIFYKVLCCVLFTTAVSLNPVDNIPEHSKGRLVRNVGDQKCECENGRCYTDKDGNAKCSCIPGFSLFDEFTCKPCDCGSLGSCIFTLKKNRMGQIQKQKKCVCNVGCAEKKGVCVDCFCGVNSACDFDSGVRNCYCMEGFSENNGVCTKCDCGFYGKCTYINGYKECQCDDGYMEINGICEACDCGPNSNECRYTNGIKQCKCKPGYADRYGTCEECYCGTYSSGCDFNNNQKTCSCLEGYVQKDGICQVGCSAQNACQNGGYCKDGFCFCQNGTRGALCEVIDECSSLCPKTKDITCSYDVPSKRAYCRCVSIHLSYNQNTKQCGPYVCQTDMQCVNGVCRDGGCLCLPGTWGDRCEIVDCVTDANSCTDQVYILWRGMTLFIHWKKHNILMKFEREKHFQTMPRDCPQGHSIDCRNTPRRNFWCHGNSPYMMYIPTPQKTILRFRRVNARGSRCSNNMVPITKPCSQRAGNYKFQNNSLPQC